MPCTIVWVATGIFDGAETVLEPKGPFHLFGHGVTGNSAIAAMISGDDASDLGDSLVSGDGFGFGGHHGRPRLGHRHSSSGTHLGRRGFLTHGLGHHRIGLTTNTGGRGLGLGEDAPGPLLGFVAFIFCGSELLKTLQKLGTAGEHRSFRRAKIRVQL
jgi:hypothetical protein